MKNLSALALLITVSQSSCVVAGGYSSDGGWFIWPGSLVSILVIVVVAFIYFRRRR